MKINIFQKLIIFSFIVLVGNGVVGYTVYKSNKKRLDAERWVQHTQQVIYQSEKSKNFVPGLYHYSNEGVCSWYDFARAIAIKSYSCSTINPIESKDYPTPVKRPFYSVLNKGKIKSIYNLNIPHWEDSLNEFFKHLK